VCQDAHRADSSGVHLQLVEENLQLAKMTELEMELTNKKLWAGLITCEKELERYG